jgi:hypothetical protein
VICNPPITDHRSPITDHRSPITDHRSQDRIFSFKSPLRHTYTPRVASVGRISPITYHRSPITDHRSPNGILISKARLLARRSPPRRRVLNEGLAGAANASRVDPAYEAGPFATYDVPAWPSGRPSRVMARDINTVAVAITDRSSVSPQPPFKCVITDL